MNILGKLEACKFQYRGAPTEKTQELGLKSAPAPHFTTLGDADGVVTCLGWLLLSDYDCDLSTVPCKELRFSWLILEKYKTIPCEL